MPGRTSTRLPSSHARSPIDAAPTDARRARGAATVAGLAYENAWIQVHHDEVTRPDGQPGIYGVVHFRTRAVGVVAIDDEDRVVLVGQYRYTLDRYSWEIPEGGVPFDEDPLDGARRELREETGLEAATWREIGAFDLSNSITDEIGVALPRDRPDRRARRRPTRPRTSASGGSRSTRSWRWSTAARSPTR